jgi:hypothetical protein
LTSGNAQCAATEAAYKQQAIKDLSGGDAGIEQSLSGLTPWQIQAQMTSGTLTSRSAAKRNEVLAIISNLPPYMKDQLNADLAMLTKDDANVPTKLGAELFGALLTPEQQLNYGILAYGLRASTLGFAKGAGTVLSPIGQLMVD